MFQVKSGSITVDVEAPVIEHAIGEMLRTSASVGVLHEKVDRLLAAMEGAPRIEFNIGPVSEQET